MSIATRRSFLSAMGSALALPIAFSRPSAGSTAGEGVTDPRRPAPIGSPVLDSLWPVIASSRHVRTDEARIRAVARWMAYEKLPFPSFGLDFDPATERDRAIDFAMVSNTINSAFTDFDTGIKFQTEYQGRSWSDAQAMTACLKRAMEKGIPILDGRFLAEVSRDELDEVFSGNIEMPMLDEKRAVLNEVGQALAERYDGFFHNFVPTCSPRLFDSGKGLVDRLISEFPRFNDTSPYRGHTVQFHKLAQLTYWGLYSGFRGHGGFRIDDIGSMTAFADYIVPVALRVMGILVYTPELDDKIEQGVLIPRDSDEEIEIRAHMLYATALLTEEVNALRPPELEVIIPQVDARLWSSYHTTHWPHHLTRTIMY
ncbi:MAG: hypothetical protein OXG83_10070 [Acidobacteria bacterium]|nr:hypothetical protein [Acidobacteriota bacterium]